jgi:hypothetical protein
MNTQTGEIYRDREEINAAEERGEPLVYGRLQVLEELQPLILNRAARRRLARKRAGDGKRGS